MTEWKMVPVEPTDAQLTAGANSMAALRHEGWRPPSQPSIIYRVMLAAAPPPPPREYTEAEIERAARVISPIAWAILDEDHKRFPADPIGRFKDKASIRLVRAALLALDGER